MLLKIVPVSVSVRTGCMVIDEVIVWIRDPEACWSLVGIEQTPRSLCHRDEISGDIVVSFNTILDEDIVTHGIVNNIFSYS